MSEICESEDYKDIDCLGQIIGDKISTVPSIIAV